MRLKIAVLALIVALGFMLAPAAANAATFTVTSPNDSGAGTLRDAITQANANANPGTVDAINFNITPAGFYVISITTADLPEITEPVSLDGSTQPGFAANSPQIQIDRGAAPVTDGLRFAQTAAGSSVSGLVIANFAAGDGIRILSNTTTVSGSWIGVSGAGAARPNLRGIRVENASDVAISQGTSGRNVISGNIQDGVSLFKVASPDVLSNRIGTNPSGTAAVANGSDGIEFEGGSASSDAAVAGNVISGNTSYGVRIPDAGITGTSIRGNLIGLSANGVSSLPNSRGIGLLNGATGATIGGTNAGDGNTIANNVLGIEVGGGATGNQVQGNTIGLNASGTPAPNFTGIAVQTGAHDNTIGGTAATARNVISGNNAGVQINGAATAANTVAGNVIGLDVNSFRKPNGTGVIVVSGASGTVIGGNSAGAGNVISGNTNFGIEIVGAGPTTVQGNLIGLNRTGASARANGSAGIRALSDDVTIGGTTAPARNVISANENTGVFLSGNDNVVEGNYIGSDVTGLVGRGNDSFGVAVFGDDNRIGGTASGAGNLISATNGWGIGLLGGDATLIEGNKIGTDLTGAHELDTFQGSGIVLQPSGRNVTNTTIGGTAPGAANTIGFNLSGIYLFDNGVNGNTSGTTIRGNSIFSSSINLGIELKGDNAVTPNDPLDVDTGANGLQNFPLLSSAVTSGSGTRITGTLNSRANQPGYTIDLYSNPSCHRLGNGEGKTYLGSVSGVSTDGNGDASFQATVGTPVPPGQHVTATATDSDGNTSEFSPCRAATEPPAAAGDPGETSQSPSGEPGSGAAGPPASTAPTGSTVTIPALKLGSGRQSFLKQKAIVLKLASDTDAQYAASGTVNVPKLSAKVFRLKAKNGSLKGGAKPATVKLVANRKLLAQARRAFRTKKKLTAKVTIVLSNGAGKAAPVTRTIELSR